jgi:hypothetical protein
MLKNIPAKYVFGGYSVRKSFTIMTSVENGKLVYDSFLLTYVDNYLSFYVLMDDGNYKHVESGIVVPEAKAEDLISRHLMRGRVDEEEYSMYERDKIIGVFGLRNMEEIMRQTDQMNAASNTEDIRLTGLIDLKNAYMGMEVNGAINAFNRALKVEKDEIDVPAIKNGPDDSYVSLIGDEMDYFDFMSNKTSDEIIKDLQMLADSIDGVGNVKDGKEIIITKGEEGEASTITIKNVEQ